MSKPRFEPVVNDPYDECECGHLRDDHDKEGCFETASSGYRCACDGFVIAP